MRLYEIEDNIKDLIRKDRNNPEIYNQIYKLAFEFLRKNKKVNNVREMDEIAHLVAQDLYMRIWRGDTINCWCGYLGKSMIGYIRKYRRMTSSQIFDTEPFDDLFEGIVRMSTSGSYEMSKSSYNEIDSDLWIDDFANVVFRELENNCKYNSYSSNFVNIYLSILMSFQVDDCDYIEIYIDEKDRNYFKLMYNIIKDKLQEYIRRMASYVDNCTLMQAFLIDGDGGSDESN